MEENKDGSYTYTPYEEGFSEGMEGDGNPVCPYEDKSPEAKEWWEGYRDAVDFY